VGFSERFPKTALVPRLAWAIIILPSQGGRWSLYDIGSMKWIVKIWPNQAAAPNRRPRFAFVALRRFVYSFSAQPASPAAVG